MGKKDAPASLLVGFHWKSPSASVLPASSACPSRVWNNAANGAFTTSIDLIHGLSSAFPTHRCIQPEALLHSGATAPGGVESPEGLSATSGDGSLEMDATIGVRPSLCRAAAISSAVVTPEFSKYPPSTTSSPCFPLSPCIQIDPAGEMIGNRALRRAAVESRTLTWGLGFPAASEAQVSLPSVFARQVAPRMSKRL